MSIKEAGEVVQVNAENVGGIDETSVSFSPGVTVLAGRNATNRTSFLQAVMAGLGSNNVSMKGNADEARVELTVGERTYTRTLTRNNGTVVMDGDPYLSQPEVADLFAFLLESNEARRAVVTETDLRDVIMRPIDTAEIQAEVEKLNRERRRIDDRLDELQDLKRRLPTLEEDRTQLKQDIDEKRAELADVEADLEAADADIQETREEKAELQEKLDELGDVRSDLEDVRYRLESERESVESLKKERAEIEAELDDLEDDEPDGIAGVESEIERLRSRKEQIETELTDLQSTIQFNEEMLEGGSDDVFTSLEPAEGGEQDGQLTDQLVDNTTVCWTCGSEVERNQIETTLEELRTVSKAKVSKLNEIESELQERRSEKRTVENQREKRADRQRKLERIGNELEERDELIDSLKEEREELSAEIERLETSVEELKAANESSDILELHEEANNIEYEIGRLEGSLEDVIDEIASIENRLDAETDLEDERKSIQDELTELRTRVDRLEEEAAEQFNEHMDTVLDILEYANIERIWIERVEKQVRKGRRKVTESSFELHVIRSTASGTTYEDTVAHLSESEREVTGLVFALAGYLVHDVHEELPFMILDSLEAIDSDRIASLVDYLKDYPSYLLVALLPEDSAALKGEYESVTDI